MFRYSDSLAAWATKWEGTKLEVLPFVLSPSHTPYRRSLGAWPRRGRRWRGRAARERRPTTRLGRRSVAGVTCGVQVVTRLAGEVVRPLQTWEQEHYHVVLALLPAHYTDHCAGPLPHPLQLHSQGEETAGGPVQDSTEDLGTPLYCSAVVCCTLLGCRWSCWRARPAPASSTGQPAGVSTCTVL